MFSVKKTVKNSAEACHNAKLTSKNSVFWWDSLGYIHFLIVLFVLELLFFFVLCLEFSMIIFEWCVTNTRAMWSVKLSWIIATMDRTHFNLLSNKCFLPKDGVLQWLLSRSNITSFDMVLIWWDFRQNHFDFTLDRWRKDPFSTVWIFSRFLGDFSLGKTLFVCAFCRTAE